MSLSTNRPCCVADADTQAAQADGLSRWPTKHPSDVTQAKTLIVVPPTQIYKERKHLAFTLADAKSVVARLEALLAVAAHAAAALAYLLIFRVGKSWSIHGCLLRPVIDPGPLTGAGAAGCRHTTGMS